MFKRSLVVLLCFFLLVAMCPLGNGQVFSSDTGTAESFPPALRQFNGELAVLLWRDGAWQEVGSLPFDKFVRVQELTLTDLSPGSEVLLKLVQRGGKGAHLDSVLLNGKAPDSVNGGEGLPLAKLTVQDNDLLHVDTEGVELVLTAAETNSLSVAARIEPAVISQTPFQFPRENMYKIMDEESAFYTYTLNPDGETLDSGMMLQTMTGREPFYQEYVVPGSGHPPGYIYGWVMNDDENLYVVQEFTPDNTMDGDLDYAKVFVLTDNGLKEFKITESEQSWGDVYFTYTDKVNYQHKFYEFIIPLSEIGITENNTQNIQIAFAAYGTMSPTNPQRYSPAIAYNSQENNYLSVHAYFDPENHWYVPRNIEGELINAAGTVVSQFTINSYDDAESLYPSVAYDSANNRFLVVWARDIGSGYKIYGQLVNANGTLNGGLMDLSGSSSWTTYGTAVAYDSANGQFLVAWDHQDNFETYDRHVYGVFVDADTGNFAWENKFDIAEYLGNGHYPGPPAVAFDSQNNRFAVVWEDNRVSLHGDDYNIYGQFVSFAAAGEELDGTNFLITNAVEPQIYPSVAYDNENHQYLVVWEDHVYGFEEEVSGIGGSLVDADNPALQNELAIYNNGLFNIRPNVAFGHSSTGFWVVWQEVGLGTEGEVTSGPDIKGRFVSVAGNVDSETYTGPDPVDFDDDYKPATAFNASEFNFLNAQQSYEFPLWDSRIDIEYWLMEELQVVSTIPVNNATAVARDADITIQFNKEVWQSVYFDDITIMSGSTVVDYVYEGLSSSVLTLTPTSLLTYSTAYTVTIPAGSVKDAEDINLQNGLTFSFTVSPVPPTSPAIVELPPEGNLIAHIPGNVALSSGVRLYQPGAEIILSFDQTKLPATHQAGIYYWHNGAKKWVPLATYPAGDGKVKASNTGNYSGWFRVFGVIQPTFVDVTGHWAEEITNRMNRLGMIEGYEDANGTRKAGLKENITRNELAVFLYRLLTINPDQPMLPELTAVQAKNVLQTFSDGGTMPDWAAQAVAALSEAEYVVGRNGRFEGNVLITRIEAAAIVSRVLQTIPGYQAANFDTYKDAGEIPVWARGAIVDGLLTGYPDGTLRPNSPITRAEALTLLYRMFVEGMGW